MVHVHCWRRHGDPGLLMDEWDTIVAKAQEIAKFHFITVGSEQTVMNADETEAMNFGISCGIHAAVEHFKDRGFLGG